MTLDPICTQLHLQGGGTPQQTAGKNKLTPDVWSQIMGFLPEVDRRIAAHTSRVLRLAVHTGSLTLPPPPTEDVLFRQINQQAPGRLGVPFRNVTGTLSPYGVLLCVARCDYVPNSLLCPEERLLTFLSRLTSKQILPSFLRERSRQAVTVYTEKFIAGRTLETLALLDQSAERRCFEIYLKKRCQWIETLPSRDMQCHILSLLQRTERGDNPLQITGLQLPSSWDPDRKKQFSEQLLRLDRSIQYQPMYDQLCKIVAVSLPVFSIGTILVGIIVSELYQPQLDTAVTSRGFWPVDELEITLCWLVAMSGIVLTGYLIVLEEVRAQHFSYDP